MPLATVSAPSTFTTWKFSTIDVLIYSVHKTEVVSQRLFPVPTVIAASEPKMIRNQSSLGFTGSYSSCSFNIASLCVKKQKLRSLCAGYSIAFENTFLNSVKYVFTSIAAPM